MKTSPDYTEFIQTIGGEVRYYNENGRWRYVCSIGEGSGFLTLESAQGEVKQFSSKCEPTQNG